MDPLAKILQRYCYAYTAVYDFSVADKVMADDYTFYMGEAKFVGREEAYKPAADRQFKAYPGLGLTVHEFFSNGDRCAMYFSEHGYSTQFETEASWHGASLYRWNGVDRLKECRIEQDYYGRRRQLVAKVADPVDPPGLAPWTTPVEPANPANEALVTRWLQGGGLLKAQIGSLDDERLAPSIDRVIFAGETTEVADIMSGGNRVAFQARVDGVYAGGLPTLAGHEGTKASLYCTGLVRIQDGVVGHVRAVTDRYTMERRILSAAKAKA